MAKELRFGLRFKFTVIIVLILLSIFLAFSYFVVTSNIRTLTENQNQETISFSELATEPIGSTFVQYQASGTIRIAQVVQQYANLNQNITNFTIINTAGAVMFSQRPVDAPEVALEDASSFTPVYHYNDSGNISRAIVPYFEGSGVRRYSVVYDVSDDNIRESISQQITISATLALTGLIISMIVMFGLVDYTFIQPIKSLSRQALAISAGNLDKTIQTDRRDEVADVTRAVNTMAARLQANIRELEQLDEMKSEFLTIVSHNLRTPLTIINGYLDNAAAAESADDFKRIIGKLQDGAQRLGAFAEDMITIANLEAGEGIGNRKDIVIRAFLKPIADKFAEQAKTKGVNFVCEISGGVYSANINESMLAGAIEGLLDNAYKFTAQGGTIRLLASADESLVTIAVSDTGVGVAPEERSKLFTKFHRGTSELVYDYEGTGIGLYSAKLVVEQHGGSITYDGQSGQGSTFTIKLPRSRGDED